jgi:hypothetical protein
VLTGRPGGGSMLKFRIDRLDRYIMSMIVYLIGIMHVNIKQHWRAQNYFLDSTALYPKLLCFRKIAMKNIKPLIYRYKSKIKTHKLSHLLCTETFNCTRILQEIFQKASLLGNISFQQEHDINDKL